MKKAYIIHENTKWIDPLIHYLKNLGVPYEEWHMDRVNINTLEEPPVGVFYNRMSASSHTRGHRFAPEFTKVVLGWLESHDRRVINSSRALTLEISKNLQYIELEKEGIQVPKTIYASSFFSLSNL